MPAPCAAFSSPARRKNNAIARHRVVRARAREDQPVVAPERRHHDGGRHERRAQSRQDRVQRRGGDAIGRGLLNGFERQRHQVRQVGEQVQRDDDDGAERERQRNVPSRVLDLAGGERDVVPGVRREERARLRYAERDEDPERRGHRDALGDRLEAPRRPELAEVGRHGVGVPADDEAEENQRGQRAGLGGGERVLDDLAVSSPRVFVHVSSAISATASSCAVESDSA